MTAHIKGNILIIDGVRARLYPQELTILWALMARRHVSESDFVEMLWPNVDDQPEQWSNVLKVKVCNLHAKLKPAGWGIKKHYGKPWSLVEI